MAIFDEDYDIRMSEGYLRDAISNLENKKNERERAKANGQYHKSPKSYSVNCKIGNIYDAAVWNAEDGVKRRKEELARVKEKAKAAKKNKQEKAKKVSSSSSSTTTTKSSVSSNPSNSGKSSSGARVAFGAVIERGAKEMWNTLEDEICQGTINEKVSDYKKVLRRKYSSRGVSENVMLQRVSELRDELTRLKGVAQDGDGIERGVAEGCLQVVAEVLDGLYEKLWALSVKRYYESLESKYPIAKAVANDLVKWLPLLLAELIKLEDECKKNVDDKLMYSISCSCRQKARTVATKACMRLKKLDKSLYANSEFQAAMKIINPNLANPIMRMVMEFFYIPYIWVVEKIEWIKLLLKRF